MKTLRNLLLFIVALMPSLLGAQNVNFTTKCIWDNGSYCSFTSLVKFQGKYYCAFREGESHIFDHNGNAEGKIRVISSIDGENWHSVHLETLPTVDLRDPKLSITPQGQLMVNIGASVYREKKLTAQLPYVLFSQDGEKYTNLAKVSFENQDLHKQDWIWRTTWNGTVGYTIDYFVSKDGKRGLSLLSTSNGKAYRRVADLQVTGYPNEATIRFLPSGKMTVMLRRDGEDCKGYWGESVPPFTEWKWTPMELRLGGPDYLVLDESHIIMGTRTYFIPSRCKTALFKGNTNGKVEEVCVLPSWGDSSYPGIIQEGNDIWVSYYSNHDGGHARIYLSKLPLNLFK